MTVEELHMTPMVQEAEELKGTLLTAQLSIEAATAAAEAEAQTQLEQILGRTSIEANTDDLVDTRITQKEPVISPRLLEHALPVSERSATTTRDARASIGEIIRGEDDRLIAIVGPCSIHDGDAALDYARQVAAWRERYGDDLEIVMRAYPEKPRSELGWKGLVYDPKLDGSDDINLGLTLTRMIAGRITDLGVPIAMERLNALTPQYVNGLVAYDAIGARNTTDQKAREYASGTSSPVGFKNTPDGGVSDAVSAVVAANSPHTFLGTSMTGNSAEIQTTGNELAHIILRGGKDGPNYSEEHVAHAKDLLAKRGLLQAIIVDASHGNSGKKAANQHVVIENLAGQIAQGEEAIKGVMLESNLKAGAQKLEPGCDLEYGKSITDECVDVEETEIMLQALALAVVARRKAQGAVN